jgi:hypothetical protein
MAVQVFQRARRRVRLFAGVLLAAGLLTAVSGEPASGAGLRVLQMNLCNSGVAGCYTGRAVAEAAALIAARRPDVVTLNEICRPDVDTLGRAFPVGTVEVAFTPAIDRATGAPVRCRDGQPYGIGLVVRAGAGSPAAVGGVYPWQDPFNDEERAWLCVAAPHGFMACTTHLASTSPLIAEAQCRYLFDVVLAGVRGPVIVGGDFNLDGLGACLPVTYTSRSDGALQYVVAGRHQGPIRGPIRGRPLGMRDTTDHPALLVSVD